MIHTFGGKSPVLGEGAWIAEGAQVIGDVVLGKRVNVWFNSVLRGDVMPIRIGDDTNIQDLTMVHVTGGQYACTIGARVTVGHRVILHGTTVGDLALIGMGAILLDGSEIGSESIIGAGSVVTPRTKIPPRVMAFGSPCRVVRDLKPAELEGLRESAAHYVELAGQYRSGK
ncbi:MAG: gamma carbonic anhydrase family protein [Deltaproteobacteria bacterium]|nr:gamma carbonic anhydrase family protein [Deltaproteobacteria bacterium]